MAKLRVYELAKKLNMTNKALLNKIAKMGITVSSHMSSLEDNEIEQIRTSLFGKKEEADKVEKRVKSTVIRRRKKSAPEDESTDDAIAASDPDSDENDSQTENVEEAIVGTKGDVEEVADDLGPMDEETVSDESASVEVVEDTQEDVQVEVSGNKKTSKPDPVPDKAIIIKEAKAVVVETESEVTDETLPQIEEGSVSEDAVETVEAVVETPDLEKTENEAVEGNSAALESEAPVEAQATDDDKLAGKKKKKKKFAAAKIIKLPSLEIQAAVAAERKESVAEKKQPQTTEARKPNFKTEDKAPAKFKKGKKGAKVVVKEEANPFKKKSKRKTIVEGNDLYSGGRGRKGRKGGRGGKVRRPDAQQTQITIPKAIKRRIKIDDTIILAELAKRMGTKANEMIAKLMGMGVMATVNQTIDYDTAALVAAEFGFEVERAAFEEETIIQNIATKDEDPSKLTTRPPVVTIMGHVDHGKTSLLDVIRKSAVADGEAGGITQHIGAYHVETDTGQIVFLDTPGHEAFTAMRSRGAKVTDLVILVVAADDGVMPQTVEAINHSKAAGVPMIVAINKIDKPGADPDRVKRELSEKGIVAEDWGGDAIFVNVSAKEKIGIDDLLEMVLLQAEVLELKANSDKFAVGHVVEAKLDSGRGPLATILVQEGTLKVGQSIVCGMHYGKIRGMFNDQGKAVTEAGPSIPVEITGLAGVPESGDELVVVANEKDARQVSAHRSQASRAKELAKNTRMSLEGLFAQIDEGSVKDLNLIIKADVHGSIEALKDSLGKLAGDEVKIKIVHSATGTVTESDVSLATVSNAIILGFNVRPITKVTEMAKEENVDMRFYDIIYDAIKDLKNAMVGMMESTFKEVILGRAEVRDVFVIPKKGTIAGCFIQEGLVKRGEKVRLLRDGIIIYDGNIASLRRFKDDAKEVQHGYECGIGIENFNDIKVEDTIDCYMLEEIKPTID